MQEVNERVLGWLKILFFFFKRSFSYHVLIFSSLSVFLKSLSPTCFLVLAF